MVSLSKLNMARFNRKGKKTNRTKEQQRLDNMLVAQFNRKKPQPKITQRRLDSLLHLVAQETVVECIVGPGTKTITMKKGRAPKKDDHIDFDKRSLKDAWDMPIEMQPVYIQNAKSTIDKVEAGIIEVLSDSEHEDRKELSKKGPNARMNAENKGRRQYNGTSRNTSHINPPNDSKGWSESKKNEREGNTR